uniref:non-specific serine/threonine protein kinase n=1 Tax=Rhodosorus marinus TaxID=101924 RepID=A0A7S0BJC1_9RHOD|mmetsp:Transcript_19417/g.28170  ORF Transcript_19417/g.28170 Transcript_19417/m.28170 type:complete len:535 (+) Transcript_19417:181-1785(+)
MAGSATPERAPSRGFTGLKSRLSRKKGAVGVKDKSKARATFDPSRYTEQSESALQGKTIERPAVNSYALLQKNDALVAGAVSLRKANMLSFGSWETFYAELRGTTVLLYADANARTRVNIESNLVGLFSVAGCVCTSKGGNVMRMRQDGFTMFLRVESPDKVRRWFDALEIATAQHSRLLSDFRVIAAIGEGAGGKVFLVKDVHTGERLAMKSIPKSKVNQTEAGFRHMVDERLLMQLSVGHPFLVQLRYAFQTRKRFYLVTNFCEGGDLYYYMYHTQSGLSEMEARGVCAEVLLALEHIHKLGFIYRDLKPENILLDGSGHIRLADFGLCKHFKEPLRLARTGTICGTHSYVAPEMLTENYGDSIDAWAMGVFLYNIVVGQPPFVATNLAEVEENLKADQEINFNDSIMSDKLIDFIFGLLDKNFSTRLGCKESSLAELKEHEFLVDLNWNDVFQKTQPTEGRLRIKQPKTDEGNSDLALLRNFEPSEWRHVKLDLEDPDPSYGKLWPPLGGREVTEMDNNLLLGFEFSSTSV